MSETVKPLSAEEEAQWRKIRAENPKLVSPAACEVRLFATLDRERARAEKAERDLAQSGEWRPIAEAPKDGTWLELAVISEAGIGYIEHGFFEVLTDDEDDGPWELRGGEPHCTYVGREAGTYWNCWFSVDEFETRYRVNKCKDFAKFTHFRKTTPPTTGSAP